MLTTCLIANSQISGDYEMYIKHIKPVHSNWSDSAYVTTKKGFYNVHSNKDFFSIEGTRYFNDEPIHQMFKFIRHIKDTTQTVKVGGENLDANTSVYLYCNYFTKDTAEISLTLLSDGEVLIRFLYRDQLKEELLLGVRMDE